MNWGFPGAVPVPADYNGDGECDLGVFDPTTARWYVRSLGGATIPGVHNVQWGFPGVIPCMGEYNADGRHDLTVYDPATGKWYVRLPLGKSLIAHSWGFPGAVPMGAKY